MECPRNYDCFGCIDKSTGFCPLENTEDDEICIHYGNRMDECECAEIAASDPLDINFNPLLPF